MNLTPILVRLRALFRREQLDADMAEEMRLHLELRAERNRAHGMSADDARLAAQRGFGHRTRLEEEARDVRPWAWIDALRRDFLYAVRMLRRSPLFTLVTVGSLALCLGLNAAIYSVLHALVLRPLPFTAAEDIVEIHSTGVGVSHLPSNRGQYADYKANAPAFAALALWDTGPDVLTDSVDARQLPVAYVTDEFFRILNLRPIAGRFFTPENLEPGRDKVIVLTEAYWRSRFGGEAAAIGQSLQLNGESYEIIGVAPASFAAFDAQLKAIRPYPLPAEKLVNQSRTAFYANLLGRLASGSSLRDARAQVAALEKRYYDGADAKTRQFIDRTRLTTLVDRLADERGAPLKVPLLLLQAGATLVLLIGAINVINLFLARGNARQREFQTRAALGASRRDLVRQLVVEAGVIGFLGVAGGLAFAWATLQGTNAFITTLRPSTPPFGLGTQIVWSTLIAGGVVTAVIAALPAFRTLQQTQGAASLQINDRGASASRRMRWTAGSLVTGQVAFALILSIAAALLVRSFLNVLAQAPGFDPGYMVIARIEVPRRHDPKTLIARVESALRTVPDFDGCVATAAPFVPVPGYPYSMGHSGTLSIANSGAAPDTELPGVFFCGVSADYARVLGIRMVRGRWFNDAEINGGLGVVVDESFAGRFFPGQDPIGRRIARGTPAKSKPEEWPEIIGVAANVRHNGLEDRSGVPFLYFPRDQIGYPGWANIMIRTTRSPGEAFTILRRLIREIDPGIPVFGENTMRGAMADSMRGRQGLMLTLAGFAGIALLLSAIGVFGVLAYDVSRRTREIGVRVALGASQAQIMAMVVRDGATKAVLGVIAGTIVALGGSRLIRSLLFDVAATDAWTYTGSAFLLLLIALLAAWLPARRAAKVDPLVALRCE